ncbi:MAG: magnesium transporter, partial [Chromatiales bacterium]|nr:magnesium transporter [Chromatiales bacterium]
DKAESDSLKSAGIVGGEELRSMPVMLRARRRLSWLSANIVLNVIAASVIALYQDTLSAVIALAVFLPIVSDMSGCSGNQAVAVSMRELTLGAIVPRDLWRVWWKEVSVGLINGLVLGGLLAGAAWAWKGSPLLGLVVGAALAINTVVAVSLGGTIPLALKRFGVDPAVASGPLLTTVTDMCGFFLVLSLASLALPLL